MPEIDGATGVLFVDSGGRVHRRLAWAEFRSGVPVPLPPADNAGGALNTIGEDGETWYEETREP
jgi:hypothetical protein